MEFYPTDTQLVFRTNCSATEVIATACARVPTVERFVYCSSTEAMGGIYPQSIPRNEEDACHPNYVYGESKVEAEKIIKNISAKTGLKYVILRPTGLYGLDDDFVINELIKVVDFGLFFFTPGDGKAKLMFTHVDDAVQAAALALTVPAALNNTFIICPDDVLSYHEWIVLLTGELRRTPPLFCLPMPVVKLAISLLGPLFNLGKSKIFLFKPKSCDRMLEDRWFSNDKAKKLLGFSPKYTLRKGVQYTVREYKSRTTRYPVSPVMIILGILVTIVLISVFV